jgi:hypothetical protein
MNLENMCSLGTLNVYKAKKVSSCGMKVKITVFHSFKIKIKFKLNKKQQPKTTTTNTKKNYGPNKIEIFFNVVYNFFFKF